MIGALVRAMVCCATVLVAVLSAAMPVQADDCCIHQGKPVKCPPGVPPGSRSVEFVPGGTQWVTPTGKNVFVAQTTFPACPPTPPTATPPPSPTTPPPATTTPPPGTQPPPPTTRTPPKSPPRGQAPPTVPPGDLGRAQQERARGLMIKGGPPQPLIPVIPGPVIPGLPGQSTDRETDEAISRLGGLIQQQPPTTQEKPPEPPGPSVRGDHPPDGTEMIKKLPPGYSITSTGAAKWDGWRPGLPLKWDGKKGVWGPPGFIPAEGDPDRWFNVNTGQNAVWDDKKQQFIDTKTGKPLTYEQ